MGMESYSDYDLEMINKGAETATRYILLALEQKMVEYAQGVLAEDDSAKALTLIGKMDAIRDFRDWILEDGELKHAIPD